MTRTCRH